VPRFGECLVGITKVNLGYVHAPLRLAWNWKMEQRDENFAVLYTKRLLWKEHHFDGLYTPFHIKSAYIRCVHLNERPWGRSIPKTDKISPSISSRPDKWALHSVHLITRLQFGSNGVRIVGSYLLGPIPSPDESLLSLLYFNPRFTRSTVKPIWQISV